MMNFLAFQVHGGGIGGSFIANVASFLEFIESLSGKTPPEMFATIMPGIANLDNIHPLFVHYPIAFFTTFFFIDVIAVLTKKSQWRYVAGWLLYLGTVAAAFTVVAGLFAADSVEHDDVVHELMERHEHFGIAVLSLSLFLSACRLKKWGLHSKFGNMITVGLSALLCLLLSLGADLGGLMVYQHSVSVKPLAVMSMTAPAESPHDPTTPTPPSQHGHSGGHHDHGGHNHHGAHNHKH